MCTCSSSSLTNKWHLTWLLYPCRLVLTLMIPHMAKTQKIARKRERRLQACQSITKTPFLKFWNPNIVYNILLSGISRDIKSNRNIDFRRQRDSILKYVKIRERARLHLIIQFPVLNTSSSKSSITAMRQKEFIFCLQKNLLSTHVS